MTSGLFEDDFLLDFKSILFRLSGAVFMVDERGNLVFYNQSWADAMGSKGRENLSGKNPEIWEDEILPQLTDTVKHLFAGSNALNPIITFTSLNEQTPKTFEVSGSLHNNKYIAFSAKDISERIASKQLLEDKKQQFFSIIKSLGDVVLKLDRQGNIQNVWLNSPSGPFENISQFEGKPLNSLFSEKTVHLLLEGTQRAIASAQSVEVEFPCLIKGCEKWFLATIIPIYNGDQPVAQEVTAIVREITQERENQYQIQYKNRLINQLTRIENGPVLHVIKSNWKFEFISGDVRTLTGYSNQDLDDLNWLIFIYEKDRDKVKKTLEKIFYERKEVSRELMYRIVTKEGNIKWITNHLSWNDNEAGGIVFGVILNVTEIRLLHEKLERRERILTNAGKIAKVGGWEYDVETAQFNMTDEIYSIHERGRGDFNALESPEYYIEEHKPIIKKYLNDLMERGENFDVELQIITGTGKTKWIRSVGLADWNNGKITHIFGVLQDIDEAKKFEESLLKAKKEGDEANKAKSDFLSTITHEIRTPLYGVIGITNLLLEEIQDRNAQEKLKALKFSSDSLLSMVNGILDYSKIKSGVLTLEYKPFDLKQLIAAVKESNLQKSKELGNRITIHYGTDVPEIVIGDKLRLGQVLNNLVNNAVKFTTNGQIDIIVKNMGKVEKKHRISFTLKDTGIGIRKKSLPLIFEQFTQAEPDTSRKFGGTGLGLSIVKGLLAAMGGDIQLESKWGHGTQVSFELAFQPSRNNPENKNFPPIKDADLGNKTILLVEDNPVSMMVASNYIKKWNGKFIKAENGKEAIEKFLANQDKIALILMDLHMPVMNGFEASKKIRKIAPNIPIIALTASIGDYKSLDSAVYGMDAFLIKPFTAQELYHNIVSYLR